MPDSVRSRADGCLTCADVFVGTHNVNAAFTAHEVEAIATAKPTPGAHSLIRAWSRRVNHLAIVSNNSKTAIEVYLDLHGLRPYVTYVSARTSSDPALLKPSSYLIVKALATLNVAADAAVFLGDSETDIEVAQAVGTRSIGYANKDGKVQKFAKLNATAVVARVFLSANLIAVTAATDSRQAWRPGQDQLSYIPERHPRS